MVECVAAVAVGVMVFPVLVFFSVKLGRYAWLSAETQFARNNSKGRGSNGRPRQ